MNQIFLSWLDHGGWNRKLTLGQNRILCDGLAGLLNVRRNLSLFLQQTECQRKLLFWSKSQRKYGSLWELDTTEQLKHTCAHTHTHTHTHTVGSYYVAQGTQPGALGCGGGWEAGWEGGDICILMVNSHFMQQKPTQHYKQLSSN